MILVFVRVYSGSSLTSPEPFYLALSTLTPRTSCWPDQIFTFINSIHPPTPGVQMISEILLTFSSQSVTDSPLYFHQGSCPHAAREILKEQIFYISVPLTNYQYLPIIKVFGCDSSPRSPNVSVCVCPSHLLQLYWTSEGLQKNFKRTLKGLWTLWSTKFTSLQVAAPRSSRLVDQNVFKKV